MKIQTNPAAGGLVAALYYLLLVVLLLQWGCAPRAMQGRDPRIAFESVVRITTLCSNAVGGYVSYGSGVIVDEHTVLTAAHVAEDPPGLKCTRVAEMVNGKTYILVLGKALPEHDIASLVTIFDKFSPTYPVVYGPMPSYGEHVCAMTAYPRVLWRCGDVQTSAKPPGNVSHTIVIEGGNSGSGVYDSRGRLVGIITHRWSCSNGQLCGGKMSTLEGRVAGLL